MVADLRSEAEASKETAQGHAAADEEQATATTEIAALREELAEMTERYEDASDRAASVQKECSELLDDVESEKKAPPHHPPPPRSHPNASLPAQ